MATATADISNLPAELGVEDLWVLLQTVTDSTEQLQATHDTLHQQVARLQTELAEANSQLRRSKQLAALGEMAAGIAHELRNPLASIQLYVQMLEEDLADCDAHVSLCRKVNKAVTGLDAIVRDVLLFARDTVIRPQEIPAEELFATALSSCASIIRDRHVHVEEHYEDGLIITGDATLLSQALTNLIRNAAEAAADTLPDTPRVLLESCVKNVRCPSGDRQSRAVLAVEDNGAGISDDIIKRMFNPFFTTRATGTGLGLAIVHRIIDAHGGHINVRNNAVGGARFELCLPPVVAAVAQSADNSPQIEISTHTRNSSRRSATAVPKQTELLRSQL